MSSTDEAMSAALALAREAAVAGEIPVGAVVLGATGERLGAGRNRREETTDPTAHAEIVALREAAKATGEIADCRTAPKLSAAYVRVKRWLCFRSFSRRAGDVPSGAVVP